MTTPDQTAPAEPKQNDKEYNFRQLEQKLQQERNARLEAERRAEEALKQAQQVQNTHKDDEDDESEPYVDHKRLNKKLNNFERNMETKIQQQAEVIARNLVEREKKDNWLKQNADFYDVLQNYADKFASHDPDLAESILQMPDNFERQKLVYKNIKALGLHKPAEAAPSIQDKIDANRRSPYYQPSGIGTAPYSTQGDYSEGGQKAAYQKMKDLQKKLRM